MYITNPYLELLLQNVSAVYVGRKEFIHNNYNYHTEMQYDKERDWKLRTRLLFYKLLVWIEVKLVN